MAEQGVDPMAPPFLHLLSAFLAMEPTHCLVSLARVCGGGLITEGVQRFIWNNCISKVGKSHVPYSKNFLKKLINEIESAHGDILDELYEQYASYMILLKVGERKLKGLEMHFISFSSRLLWNPKLSKINATGSSPALFTQHA